MNKPIDKLTEKDFRGHAVWRSTNSDEPDETYVKRVRIFPIKDCHRCVFGTTIRLANKTELIAMIGNLDIHDVSMNEHFLGVSIFCPDGKLFHLARYHDVDVKKRGPKALAKYLELSVDDVFPISFTIPRTRIGTRSHFHATVQAKPSHKLSSGQLIQLVVQSMRKKAEQSVARKSAT